MKSSKATFNCINLLICLLFVVIPIIIFAVFHCFPGWNTPIEIIFWITFILCPLLDIIWLVGVSLKPQKEVTATVLHIGCNIAIQVLPLINFLFTFFPKSWKWVIVFPLLIDIVAFTFYAIFMLSTNHWSRKVNHTHQRIQATSHQVVNADTAYEDENGFRGSRLKK